MQIRPHIRALLQPLSWFRMSGIDAPRDPLEALARLKDARDPAALNGITPWLFVGDEAIADAAGSACDALVPRLPARDVATLDNVVRRSYWLQSRPVTSKDTDLARFASRATTPARLCLWSMHPSGFVRQLAVERLRACVEAWVLPYLLRRLNDWIESVREAARRGVAQRLHETRAEEIVRALPAILGLRLGARAEHGWVVEGARGALLRVPGQPQLRAALRDPDRHVRRAAFSFAIESVGDDRSAWIREGLNTDDPVIRTRAARQARATLSDAHMQELIPTLLADRVMRVRREALYALAERRLPDAATELRGLLLDRSASVRLAARVYLRDFGPFDAREFYRSALADRDRRRRAAALEALGEVGAADDLALIHPFLGCDNRSVRVAAVHSLARLGGEAISPVLLSLLTDPDAGIARAARQGLRAGTLESEHLIPLLSPDHPAHTRRYALGLLAQRDIYAALSHLIRAAADPDAPLARAACYHLGSARRPAYRSLRGAELREASEAYARHGVSLPEHLRLRVRRWLDDAPPG